ncbi:DJ-1/PfpI family protein [Thalassotalea psychrophila]|uniref:DJ-1/PfpI family protein n=1 Tax=Thalassotalea psychrophila TaxID=3065647 RepID=UPI0032972E94
MINVAIYIYDNAEVLDFSGPFEVFTTAARIAGDVVPFNTFLVSERNKQVKARAGYTVQANYTFDDHPNIDVLIIVGGMHDAEMDKPNVIQWIKQQSATSCLTASVCTGAFLLAKAGVLSKMQVTTHWQDMNDLRAQFPCLDVVEDVRWVDCGEIVTSGGISAGIDMSIHLVSKLHSVELAEKTAKQMEFSWTQNP